MIDNRLLFAVLLIPTLTLIGLVFVIFLVRAKRQKGGTEEPHTPVLMSHRDIEPKVVSGEPTASRTTDNVVTQLNFEQSLDSVRFASTSQELALSDINRQLAARATDGVSVILNGISLEQSTVTMVVSATDEGQAFIDKGVWRIARNASGRRVPMVQDIKTGQWREVMQEAKGIKVMNRVASISTAIVGAAHIISAADIAKRLKQIDAKINDLLKYRLIDQLAALERIYTSARELCAGTMTREKQWELWRLRGELRELRIRWRRELKHLLGLIEDPNSAVFYKKMFNWIEPIDRKPYSTISKKITEGQLHISLIEYSMRLDEVLAASSETIREFELTLADELVELEKVAELLKEKASKISTKYRELSVESTQEGLFAIARGYRKLLPGDQNDKTFGVGSGG